MDIWVDTKRVLRRLFRGGVLTVSGLLVLLSIGCADDFDDFNLIGDFRLLAMQAEPPELREGETATLSALVSDPTADYQWSWCPIAGDSDDGFPCALTREELQVLLDEQLGEGVATVPSFTLGTGATASFEYSFPKEFLAGVCALLQQIELPDFAPVPACAEGTFPVLIKLTVTKEGKSITGVHDLLLPYAVDTPPNNTPQIGGLSVVIDGQAMELPSDDTLTLARNTEYEMTLAIGEEISESYLEETDGETATVRENLTATWFIEGGEMDKRRTSFIDGEKPIEDLVTNLWTTPTTEEFSTENMRLFIVLRDDRHGVSWLQRNIILEDQ